MKKAKIYFLMAAVAIVAFVFGLCFDNLITKSYADGRATESFVPAENSFEVMSTGTTSRADYEIVTIYGRKYIIFSSGGDIEVLNY